MPLCRIILLCTIPCVQFCTQAFHDYARLTDVDLIFGTQIKYMRFFKEFFLNNIFVYTFFAFSLLSLLCEFEGEG